MSASREVAGKTICVTGASSGIGRTIAEHLGARGGHVFMAGRTQESLEESAATIVDAGGTADLATFDVTDSAALQEWIQGAAESTGRLDVLVNSAGFGDVGSTIADGDADIWRSMLEVNVLALAVGCQAAIRSMRATGSEGNIINISPPRPRRDRIDGRVGRHRPPGVRRTGSTLPIEMNIEELVIRPQRSLF